jgi:hypothetical protein
MWRRADLSAPDRSRTRRIALALGVAAGGLGLYACIRARRKKSSTASPPPSRRAAPALHLPMGPILRWRREGGAPKPGDILLFHKARGLNRLITWFTRSPFYHVALYAGDGRTVEARTRGVVHDTLRGREGNFRVLPAPKGRGRAALAWARRQVGDGYDERDLLIILLERIFGRLYLPTRPDAFTCGEFVATAFDKAGVALFPDRDLAAVVPADFAALLPPDAIPAT